MSRFLEFLGQMLIFEKNKIQRKKEFFSLLHWMVWRKKNPEFREHLCEVTKDSLEYFFANRFYSFLPWKNSFKIKKIEFFILFSPLNVMAHLQFLHQGVIASSYIQRNFCIDLCSVLDIFLFLIICVIWLFTVAKPLNSMDNWKFAVLGRYR